MQLTFRHRLADRVWQWRKMAYAVSSGLVALVIMTVFLSISSPASMVEVSSEPTFFNAERAFRAAQEIYRLYPHRTMGSEESTGLAAWLEDHLRTLQIPFQEQRFSVPFGYEKTALRNVVVVLPGPGAAESIVVTAGRDSDPEGPLQPLADASGTAMLLDLIQVFAARPHQKTLIFLSTEGGGYGGLGLDHFLNTYQGTAPVGAVLSLKDLGKEERDSILAGVSGADGSTPGWYVGLASQTLKQAGLQLEVPSPFRQIADHALRLARGEQVAGLRHKIPALLLDHQESGTVTPAGLLSQGAAVERLILSLDSMSKAPSDNGTALVLASGRYVSRHALELLALVLLLPSVSLAAIWLGITRLRPEAWARYLRNALSFVLPLGGLVGLAVLAARIGLLPCYQGQAFPLAASPATRPSLPAALVLLATGSLLFFGSRHYLGYLRPREPLVTAETAKLTLGLATLVIGLGLLAWHSPFSLLAGLSMAWVWPLATCFAESSSPGRLRRLHFRSNRPLLLAGCAAPVFLYLYVILGTGLGWDRAWWFLAVQTVSGAYGIRGPLAVVLVTAGLLALIGVRRLKLPPIETLEDETGEPPYMALKSSSPSAGRRTQTWTAETPPEGRGRSLLTRQGERGW